MNAGRSQKSDKAVIRLALYLLAAAVSYPAAQTACLPGSQYIYWENVSGLDSLTHPGFQEAVVAGLSVSMKEFGFCLDTLPAGAAAIKTESKRQILAARLVAAPDTAPIAAEDDSSSDNSGGLFINTGSNTSRRTLEIILIREGSSEDEDGFQKDFSRPLISLSHDHWGQMSLRRIVVQKIVENMRDRFICHLILKSDPEIIRFSTSTGLSGVTPVEWVLPTGAMEISVNEKGYLPITRLLDLNSPGEHKVSIKLKKRHFYHSKLMIPFAAAVIMSGVGYYLEQEYYSQYQSLGERDYQNQPDAFAEKYDRARLWEQVKFGSLGLSGLCLTFSFWF